MQRARLAAARRHGAARVTPPPTLPMPASVPAGLDVTTLPGSSVPRAGALPGDTDHERARLDRGRRARERLALRQADGAGAALGQRAGTRDHAVERAVDALIEDERRASRREDDVAGNARGRAHQRAVLDVQVADEAVVAGQRQRAHAALDHACGSAPAAAA